MIEEKNKRQAKQKPDCKPIMATRSELAKIFPGMSTQTWANLAYEKKGPRYYKRGKLAWYRIEEVEEYLTQNPVQTCEWETNKQLKFGGNNGR
jgi:hypothetical protein